MSQYILEDGTVCPVTICELGPCVVVQKKTVEKDGYAALKIGYVDAKEKNLGKALLGDYKKRNISPKKILREIDVFDESLQEGSVISCDVFTENQVVTVSGISKGKGYAGVLKRHGFGGGRKSHGSDFHRAPGRDGNKHITVKNLKVVKILKDKNIVLISGAVPGRKDSIITVKEK